MDYQSKLDRAISNLGFHSRYLDQLALMTDVDTEWNAGGGGGALLSKILEKYDFYTEENIVALTTAVLQTGLRDTSQVVKHTVNLYLQYGKPASQLPPHITKPDLSVSYATLMSEIGELDKKTCIDVVADLGKIMNRKYDRLLALDKGFSSPGELFANLLESDFGFKSNMCVATAISVMSMLPTTDHTKNAIRAFRYHIALLI